MTSKPQAGDLARARRAPTTARSMLTQSHPASAARSLGRGALLGARRLARRRLRRCPRIRVLLRPVTGRGRRADTAIGRFRRRARLPLLLALLRRRPLHRRLQAELAILAL